ncbi:hypothetical protein NOG67_06295 [Erwinia persicina]|uniref:hypothetical protein n=1 Tax=Erwinia persicina TaxID=55211 RepID=UPI00210766B9|nr:hypothetical protein [Erwinia persicina]MCQ4104446.1 hypothetical protein [Erwinia persicina]UTX14095.1 hypothetical protein NOG67_06295 [Erwinia persicina]
MPKYNVYTKIESNVPASNLFYDLNVYKTDASNKKYVLLSVTQQSVNPSYYTQAHETNETEDDLSVIYILEINLFRKHGGKLIPVLSTPAKKMYTLGEIASGKAYSKNKRENICYFETKAQTKPVNDKDDDNIHSVQITCLERAFIAKEYPVGSADDPFDKKKIESQLASRINHSSYPNQGDTSLCGPAAFFYCLLMDRPDVYKQAVNELWMYGKTKIGALNIVPGNGCRHPTGTFYDAYGERVKGIDWITLASLRDSDNSIFSYDEIGDQVSGITLWGGLTEWFVSAGYEKEFSNVGLSHVNIKDLSVLNEFIEKGCRVVTLISAGMLDGFDSVITAKNHWIVWGDPIKTQHGEIISLATNENELVQLKLFSWGKVKNQIKENIALSVVMKSIFGGVVFKPLK